MRVLIYFGQTERKTLCSWSTLACYCSFCSSYCYEELHAENVSGHTGEADNKIWPFLAFCTGESSVRDRGLDQRFDTDESEIRFLNRSFLGNNDIVRQNGLEGS